MPRRRVNFGKALRTVWAYVRRPRRVTCLDCGFLAHLGQEVTSATRVMLGARGVAGMPSEPEQLRCFRSSWVDYDLTYVGPSIDGMFDELERARRSCPGFYRHKHGWSPSEHLGFVKSTAERRSKILVAVVSAVVGGAITVLVTWLMKDW